MKSDRTIDGAREDVPDVGRRRFLRSVGIVAIAGAAAGCVDGGDGDRTPVDYGDHVGADEEPDYGGWFDGVGNYDGTVDARGEDSVEVLVGAEGGLSFGPPAILVDPGTEVVWTWTGDGGRHDVVHEDGAFESERTNEAGHDYAHTFDEPGVFRYACVPHRSAGMRGAIAVDE